MKKKYIFFLICIIILVGIFFIKLNNHIKKINLYPAIIEKNWDISISKECEEIKLNKNESSFLGDGERVHILQYKDGDNINKNFEWENKRNSSVESEILKILNNLKIEDEYRPNLDNDYKYYFKRDKDSSVIYILYFEYEKKVYIIEKLQ